MHPSKSNKFLGVELARFLCSFCILLWHYQHFFLAPPINQNIVFDCSSQPFYQILFPAYRYGEFAVKLFWMISGFIFIWKYSEVILNKNISFREFIFLRFSRLYPLHFITLWLVAILQFIYYWTHLNVYQYFIYPFNDAYHFLLNILFIQHWGIDRGYSFNAPTWSISVEIFVYCLFFMIARSFKLRGSRCLLLVMMSWLILFHYEYPPFAECSLWFFLGGVVFFVYNKISNKLTDLQSVLLGYSIIFIPLISLMLPYAGLMDLSLIQAIISSAVVLGIVLMCRSMPFQSFVQNLGNLTYSSYLIHFPIQLTVVLFFDKFEISRQVFLSPYALIIYLLTVLMTAHLVYTKVEYPLMSFLRKKFIARQ